MTRFPSLEGKEIIALLKDHGFVVDRQRGSHCYLKHEDGRATVVPVHAGETIGPGLFAKILRDVDMTQEDFVRDKKRRKKPIV
jgi:predicted RNA binding protein YcfA (HicA-like mRNA interferase family)